MIQNRANDWKRLILLIKKRFRKKHKKSIKANEIKKIWDNWAQYRIVEGVIAGGELKIDKHSSIEIVGTPVLEDKIFKLLVKGKSVRRDGSMKNAEFKGRKNVKYKIVYRNKLRNEPIIFNAAFSKQVHEAIVNTNTYYRIENGKFRNR